MSNEPSEDRWEALRAKLEVGYEWPCTYVFKAIVPAAQVEQVREVFGEPAPSARESRGGKYVSLTAERRMSDGAEVVQMYRALAVIEGVMLL